MGSKCESGDESPHSKEALSVGGMVVARSMEDRGLADQLLNASKIIALELGGWEDGKRAVGNYR